MKIKKWRIITQVTKSTIIKLIIFAFIITLTLCYLFGGKCNAQILGTMYMWSDTIHTTTTHIDSLFDERWEYVTIWSDSKVL